jgi:uncharacterized membrane protein
LSDIIFLALLFIHIGSIVLWMGASVLMVSILGPGMSKLSPGTRSEFMKIIGPRFVNYVIRNATLAIVAGLILYAYIMGFIVPVSASLAPTSSGLPWISVGILFGLIAYIIGLAFVVRFNRKVFKLMDKSSGTPAGASGPPAAELQVLQRKIAMSSGIVALFLVLALLSMVVGANL